MWDGSSLNEDSVLQGHQYVTLIIRFMTPGSSPSRKGVWLPKAYSKNITFDSING